MIPAIDLRQWCGVCRQHVEPRRQEKSSITSSAKAEPRKTLMRRCIKLYLVSSGLMPAVTSIVQAAASQGW
ncbi:hypothetical protein EJ02DRAFT_20195 [Clathrospora elynae]|uniref:Uncharacterized protein n=1 Tax=Clathrospora elynae TaxID=706981 RepID=A0A6A5SMW7_9PLEO|nr:hypothetical protein EJ02DRAFT_20195 [Clathrospora elynae]